MQTLNLTAPKLEAEIDRMTKAMHKINTNLERIAAVMELSAGKELSDAVAKLKASDEKLKAAMAEALSKLE